MAGALPSAEFVETLAQETGAALCKFFVAHLANRLRWMHGLVRGIFPAADESLAALLVSLVPRLEDEGAAQAVALAAISNVAALKRLVELLDMTLHQAPRVRDRVGLLVSVGLTVRQYGRGSATLGKDSARRLSRQLLNLVAVLWRRPVPPRPTIPSVWSADLSSGEFSADNYAANISEATHSSPDITRALCEMLLARRDGLLVLLEIGKDFRSGAVSKLYFQRYVREDIESAMRNFCGVLFTVQRVPKATWTILLELQAGCEAALECLGGFTLLTSYKESRAESRLQLLGYPDC